MNGKRHGKGIYRWNNGETYNGDWKNDRMNGYGVFTKVDGSVYEGEFKDDVAVQ